VLKGEKKMRIRDIRGEGVDIIPKGEIRQVEKQGSWFIIRLEEGYYIELDSLDVGKIVDGLYDSEIISRGETVVNQEGR